VIKEGKRNVLSDSFERDVTDRLRWQYELQMDLHGIVPLPRIYDLFEENGDTYLVMQFIDGQSLDKHIGNILSGKTWNQLALSDKLQLLDYAIQVIDIIDKMHRKGFIHRDITAGNFLVDKKHRLWMIDLELAYSKDRHFPYPPFRLGTPGYMSPEQIETQKPTTAQDVYAIGSLCLFLFTGIMPDKFAQEDLDTFREQLSFFIHSNKLIEILAASFHKDPNRRPCVNEFAEAMLSFKSEQMVRHSPQVNLSHIDRPNSEKLTDVITSAIEGLTIPPMVNHDFLWTAKSYQAPGFNYKQDVSMSVYCEYYQGLSGIVWLLSKAKQVGFSLGLAEISYKKSIDHIRQKIDANLDTTPGGLFFGAAGMALALGESLKVGLAFDKAATLECIKSSLESKNTNGLGMLNGLAGKGAVLLRLTEFLDADLLQSLLSPIIQTLLSKQEGDGSWIALTDKNKRPIKITGFGHGVAGIVLFLMSYINQFNVGGEVKSATKKALEWICKQNYKKRGQIRWLLNDQIRNSSFDFQHGSLGIMLCLIKAYGIYGSGEYRELTEDTLLQFPQSGINLDLTQANGVSGLGEICLEAAKAFNSTDCQERADWIAQFLLSNYHKEKNGNCYWMPDGTPFFTPGLMEGNCGIIHYLMHYQSPKLLNHPLVS
jgi:serine/threonine protein kinase